VLKFKDKHFLFSGPSGKLLLKHVQITLHVQTTYSPLFNG